MPVIKSAKKKLRKDIKREKKNDVLRAVLSRSLKEVKKNPSEKLVISATKALDKAAKNGLLHKNKAARMKSRLSKMVSSKTNSPKTAKTKVKAPNKSSK